ncbi:MAG TPA: matrixin family metalloprotease [Pyrinomonadaceae bacterium]|jgi:hypothetical protein
MRRAVSTFTLVLIVVSTFVPARSYTLQYRDSSGTVPIRWPGPSITIAFSTSLQSPQPNIKAGSDVVGAAHRALQHWASVANIHFVETSSSALAISPQNAGDDISLITVAAENASVFGSSEAPARTRVFFDSAGAITEADIALNPSQPFSSDGAAGTYDLEATLTHEVGHLLGLEHSAVLGATMQPRQSKNGAYSLPALTGRTLAEDDCAGARALYGSSTITGSIAGKLMADAVNGELSTVVFGAHVFAENIATGKVVAGNITLSTGEYRIDGLSPGAYRVVLQSLSGPVAASDINGAGGSYSGLTATKPLFRTTEFSNSLSKKVAVAASATTPVNLLLFSTPPPALVPQVIGLNGELSTTALPLEAGQTYTIYVGGAGVDNVPGTSIRVSSPFVEVDPASLALQQFGTSYPVISFNVSVAANAPFGDYSIRLQANSGEVAYLAGAVTIDPGVNSSAYTNPADDAQFFVRQNYADLLGRKPDAGGLFFRTNEIAQCGSDASCISQRRIEVSAELFMEPEFQNTGAFVYRLYKSALGRRPLFAEFTADRARIVGLSNFEAGEEAFVQAFVERPDFRLKYPRGMTGLQFSNALLASLQQSTGLDLSSERSALIAMYDGSDSGRTAILRRLADDQTFARAEYNRSFVLMQYFGYLRRDPDQAGFDSWLKLLEHKQPNDPAAYRSMICAFVTSDEYQSRFGILPTRTNAECGQ